MTRFLNSLQAEPQTPSRCLGPAVSGISNLKSGNWFRTVSLLDYLSGNFVAWRSAETFVSATRYPKNLKKKQLHLSEILAYEAAHDQVQDLIVQNSPDGPSVSI